MACPLEAVPADVWQAIDAADDADRGLLPMPGGTLAQTQAFLQAWRFVRAEVERHKAIIKQRPAHG